MKRQRTAMVTATTAATLVAGLALLAPTSTQAAPAAAVKPGESATCPAAYTGTLTPGQPVTGSTSAGVYTRNGTLHDSSVTPEPFTGEFRGTIEEGGRKIHLFELTGSRITKPDGTIDGGIWAGMSGSPVYAADGTLIGAVAYGFSEVEGSNYAGVTPASEMYAQLGRRNGYSPAPRVTLSRAEQRALVSQGVPRLQVAGGLRRLDPPRVVAGATGSVAKTLKKKAGKPNSLRFSAGAGGTQAEKVPLVPGGNVAFASAYGSLANYSVGTVTAVCGDEVVAFGHPGGEGYGANSMHGAKTLVVQPNGGAGYKLANIAAPMGAQTFDGQAGVMGKVGTVAPTSEVVVTTRREGTLVGTTTSKVTDSYWLGPLAATQSTRDMTEALGAGARGSATARWRMDYVRANGRTGTLRGTEYLSEKYVLSDALGETLMGKFDGLIENEVEEVRVTRIAVDLNVSTSLASRAIRKLEVRKNGAWRRFPDERAIPVKRARVLKVRVTMAPTAGSKRLKPVSKVFTFKVRRGDTAVLFSASGAGSDEMFFMRGGGSSPFDDLLKQLRSAPSDQLVVVLESEAGNRTQTWRTGAPVTSSAAGIAFVEPPKKKGKKSKSGKKSRGTKKSAQHR